MRIRFARSSALAAALAAGCASGVQTITPSAAVQSPQQATLRIATGGEQVLEVFGAPPDGATPEVVAQRLRAPGGAAETTWRAVAPGGGGLRTVFEFGVQTSGLGSCARPRAAQTRFLVMTATLCNGATPLRSVALSAPGVLGPSSPGYDSAVGSLMLALLNSDARKPRRSS